MAAKKGNRPQPGQRARKAGTPARGREPAAPDSLGFANFDFISNQPDDLGASAFAEQRRWQLVWLRLIADAWKDPKLRKAITKKDADLRGILKKRYNYELNQFLELTIVDTEGDVSPKPGAKKPFDKLPKMELRIALPPPPRADLQAIALADYADAGRSYPFTCW